MQCPEGPYPEPSLASYTSASVRPLSAEAPQAGKKIGRGTENSVRGRVESALCPRQNHIIYHN